MMRVSASSSALSDRINANYISDIYSVCHSGINTVSLAALPPASSSSHSFPPSLRPAFLTLCLGLQGNLRHPLDSSSIRIISSAPPSPCVLPTSPLDLNLSLFHLFLLLFFVSSSPLICLHLFTSSFPHFLSLPLFPLLSFPLHSFCFLFPFPPLSSLLFFLFRSLLFILLLLLFLSF